MIFPHRMQGSSANSPSPARSLMGMLMLCLGSFFFPPLPAIAEDQPGNTAPADRPETDIVIEGRTLREWRRQIGLLPLDSPPDEAILQGLIELVKRPDIPWFTRRQAALTLGRLGSHAREGIPVLRELLRSQDAHQSEEQRLWVMKALTLYGPVAAEATPDLIRVFQSPTTTTHERLGVIDAFSRIGAGHPAVIPFLIEQIATHEPVSSTPNSSSGLMASVRLAAIEAVGWIGGSASSAAPALIRVLEEDDEQIRREAATSLGRMGPLAAVAGPALLQRLIDEPVPAVQDQVAWAMGEVGPETIQEELPQLLTASSPTLRRHAVEILGRWGSSGRPMQPAIQSLWNDEDPHVRLSALEASRKLGAPPESIAQPLVREFHSEDRQVRRRASQLFGRLGRSGQVAEHELRVLLDSPRAEVRLAGRKGLQSCGLETP